LRARTNRQLSAVFRQRFGDGLPDLSVATHPRHYGHFSFKTDLHVIPSGAYLNIARRIDVSSIGMAVPGLNLQVRRAPRRKVGEQMNRERIEDTVRLWQAEPDKAKGKPTVIARAEGGEAVMEHGSFSWRTDMPVPLGGTNEAPSPTALLLSALAGCAVVFIRDTLAPQLAVTVDAIEATAECVTDARGLLGMNGVAPDLSNVGLTIAIQSPEDEDAVRRVYQAWQERCPVYLALTKALPVATSLDIKRP
jgi:uncharacterized OsmC-like protein